MADTPKPITIVKPPVAPVEAPFNGDELQPCNWNITSTGANSVEAVNALSGRQFNGLTVDFSRLLRGE